MNLQLVDKNGNKFYSKPLINKVLHNIWSSYRVLRTKNYLNNKILNNLTILQLVILLQPIRIKIITMIIADPYIHMETTNRYKIWFPNSIYNKMNKIYTKFLGFLHPKLGKISLKKIN